MKKALLGAIILFGLGGSGLFADDSPFTFPVAAASATGGTIGAAVSGGTACSILYVTSGGLFGQSPTNLCYDAETKRLKLLAGATLLIGSETESGSAYDKIAQSSVHISTSDANQAKIIFRNSNAGAGAYTMLLLLNDQAGQDLTGMFRTSQANTQYGGAGSLNIYNSGTNTAFQTGDVTRMLIAAAGNIGINDSTPDGEFEIKSNQSPTGSVVAISSQSDTLGGILNITGNGTMTMPGSSVLGDTYNADTHLITGGVVINVAGAAAAHDSDITTLVGVNPGLEIVSQFNTISDAFVAVTPRADATGGGINLVKTRATSPATNANTIVVSGDEIGYVKASAADGANYRNAGQVQFSVDGTPGSSDMPGRISFWTTPDGSATMAERMRITNGGVGYFNNTSALTSGQFQVTTADNGTGIGIKISTVQASCTTADVFIAMYSNTGLEASVACTGVAGVVAFNTFTGSHWTQLPKGFKPEILTPLCSSGEIATALNKDQLVKAARCGSQDPSILGFFAGTDKQGFSMALAIGTGFAWVANQGQDISIGDWLVTSGDGFTVKKQTDDLKHNYSAAKASQPIKWKAGEKKRKIAVTYHAG